MVAQGADLNYVYADHSDLPLDVAARRGYEDIVAFLLQKGATQVRFARLGGNDAITHAAKGGYLSIVKMLLDNDPSVIDSNLGHYSTTPMYEAAKANKVDVVKYLLERGAGLKLNFTDYDFEAGYEAMEHAVQRGRNEVVRVLAKGGVDVNVVPEEMKDHDPPLFVLAMMWGQDDTAQLLLELGATKIDLMETKWADDFQKGVYPKSTWTLRSKRSI